MADKSEFDTTKKRFIHMVRQMADALDDDSPNYENRWYYVSSLNQISADAISLINLTEKEARW